MGELTHSLVALVDDVGTHLSTRAVLRRTGGAEVPPLTLYGHVVVCLVVTAQVAVGQGTVGHLLLGQLHVAPPCWFGLY